MVQQKPLISYDPVDGFVDTKLMAHNIYKLARVIEIVKKSFTNYKRL